MHAPIADSLRCVSGIRVYVSSQPIHPSMVETPNSMGVPGSPRIVGFPRIDGFPVYGWGLELKATDPNNIRKTPRSYGPGAGI